MIQSLKIIFQTSIGAATGTSPMCKHACYRIQRMRILMISDSHGRTENVELILEKEGNFDLILHAGDGSEDFDYIGDRFRCRVTGVKGNCDLFSREPSVLNIDIEGKLIHIEHGNRLPYFNEKDIFDFAEGNRYDVVMYGHTHIQKILDRNGRWIINPGSISRPRDGAPSYVIMKTDGKGGFMFEGKRV